MTAIKQGDVQDGMPVVGTSPLFANTTVLTRTDALPLDELDRLEGFVHITDGQIEAEVEHGVTGGLLTVLQAHEVSESSPGHHVGELGGRPP